MASFLLGGSSRNDVLGPVILNVLAIATILILVWNPNSGRGLSVRAPLLFLLAWAFLILLQLVPLPPVVWSNLPGRGFFAASLERADMPSVWRPISLSPDLTIASLLSVLPPLAMLVVAARFTHQQSVRFLIAIVALIAAGGVLGFLQVLTGNPALYLYSITNLGAPVGFFANRNHEALLLAMLLPAVGCLSVVRRGQAIVWWALIAGVMAVPLTLATGSRSGLLLLVVGAIGSWFIFTGGDLLRVPRERAVSAWRLTAIMGGGIALVLLTVVMSRAPAVQRLFQQDVSQEIRVRLFDPMVDIGMKYFPVGTGFGTFVPVFKIDEPADFLGPFYLNHAHNELLELLIEAGAGGFALLGAFLIWWIRRSLQIWSRAPSDSQHVSLARLGTVWTGMVMLLSLADYPLRTATMAVLFSLGCAWMALQPVSSPRRRVRNMPLPASG